MIARILSRLHPAATCTLKHRVESIAIPALCRRVSAPYSTEASVTSSQPVQIDIAIPSPQRARKSKPVSRPKAHTGRTTSSPRKKKPKAVTEIAEGSSEPTANKIAKPRAKSSPKSKAAKKPKAKPAPKRKEKKPLTEGQKSAATTKAKRTHIQELKKIVLTPPKKLPATAYQVIQAEVAKEGKTTVPIIARTSSEKYKNLIPEELEVIPHTLYSPGATDQVIQHYNHVANQNKAINEEAYRKWIESFTPDEVRKAHLARMALTRLGVKGYSTHLIRKDSRQPKRPITSFLQFNVDRLATGDFKGMSLEDKGRLIGYEWKELDEDKKQVSPIRAPFFF